jgi:arabinose-5-phosphate isomerase
MNSKNSRDWVQLAREVLDIEIQGLQEVQRNLGQEYADALEILAGCTGRVVVTGVGKSGLVGRKIAATFSSTGTPAYFLHPVEGAHGDLGLIRQGDVVLAISNSGETDELNAIIPTLLSLGTKIIAMTGNPDSTMGRLSHATLCSRVPREACALGLAPTSSTTATLALGDALAVGLSERKAFRREDFRRFHPGGDLGRQLSLDVAQLMHTEDIPVVASGAAMREALRILDRGGLGTVVVLEDASRVAGILTDGDVRRILCHKTYQPDDEVDAYMTVRPRFGVLGQKGAQILDMMEKSAITVLPIVDEENTLQGIVHLHDLLGKGTLKLNNV